MRVQNQRQKMLVLILWSLVEMTLILVRREGGGRGWEKRGGGGGED